MLIRKGCHVNFRTWMNIHDGLIRLWTCSHIFRAHNKFRSTYDAAFRLKSVPLRPSLSPALSPSIWPQKSTEEMMEKLIDIRNTWKLWVGFFLLFQTMQTQTTVEINRNYGRFRSIVRYKSIGGFSCGCFARVQSRSTHSAHEYKSIIWKLWRK